MLPGFRFLFAAIVLSTSILIFGLGAAALLRASHDQFASIPARRPLPEPVFAQQTESPAPTLALLRAEPSVVEKVPAAAAIAALVEQPPEAEPVPPVETERLAALRVDEPAPPETAARTEPAPSTEAAAVQAAPDTAEEIKVAAVENAGSPAATDTAPAALPPAIELPAPESMGAPAKIAMLGSPAATVEEPASATPQNAQPDKGALRKQRLRAQRAKERRRLAAQRARLARQAAAIQQQQQPPQSDPFTPQPTITTAPASRRR